MCVCVCVRVCVCVLAFCSFLFIIWFLICQIGGATGLVGDPSGRTKEREGLHADSLEKNKLGIRENLLRIFTNVNSSTSIEHFPLKYVLKLVVMITSICSLC